tara:strand:+ start:149 stop:1540 length:1392 start_codon:yes stop_codon:yes gene_type:complete
MKSINIYIYIFLFTCNFIIAQTSSDNNLSSSNLPTTLVDGVFAVVGNHVIFHSDISNQMLQYQNQGFNPPDLYNQVVEELFLQKTLLHFSVIDSIEVDPNEIQNTIDQRLSFFEQQLGSLDEIEKYFNKTIVELKNELKPIVSDQLLIQKMQYEIIKDVDVSPMEVQKFYNTTNKDSLPIIETQFQIAQILKTPEPSQLAIEETLSKLEDLRNRILKGADFSTMAILYSEDPGSSRNGGLYSKIRKGYFVKEFEGVAFSLSPEDISEIFETEFGYHIMQLIERRGNELDLRHILMTPKISSSDLLNAKQILEQIRNDIISKQLEFSVAAQEYSSDFSTKNNGGLLINPNTNNSFFSQTDLETMDLAIFNEIKNLEIGSVTKPIYIKLPNNKEAYRIIKLVSKKDEHTPTLKDDYSFLKSYCLKIQEEKKLDNWYKEKIKDLYISSKEDLSSYKFYNNLLKNEE